MTNKDAIKWLDNLKLDLGNPHYECLWYYAQAIDEICELLEAHEPRVMTLEEANTLEVVWAEDRNTNTVFPCLVKNNMNDSKLYKYGIQWRVWSSRPTDEQRKAVKWDG